MGRTPTSEGASRRVPVVVAVAALLGVPLLAAVVAFARTDLREPAIPNHAATRAPFTSADSSCYDAAPPLSDDDADARGETRLRFEDVTRDAGLCHLQHEWVLPPDCFFNEPGDVPGQDFDEAGDVYARCLEERMSGGVAVADVDGDGWVDVYLTQLRQGPPGRLFRNKGDGTFEDVTAAVGLDQVDAHGNGAVFVDVDGDGTLDLVVSTLASDRHLLFIQQADGTFREEGRDRGIALADGKERRGYSIAVGDYDRDGYPDLFFTEWLGAYDWGVRPSTHARLLRNRGAEAPGHFEDVTDAAGIVLGDPRVVRAQHEIERGLNASTTRTASFAATFVDLDGDGWQDLAVASDFGTTQLFWNEGDGTFREGTAAAGLGKEGNAMGSTFADFDRDGHVDWFVSAIDGFGEDPESMFQYYTGNKLYRNLGDGTFEDVSFLAGVNAGAWGWGAAFADFDLDGWPDLYLTNGQFVGMWHGKIGNEQFADTPKRLWRNRGDGSFEEVAVGAGIRTRAEGKGVAVLDFDNDGRLDVLTVNNGGYPTLYANRSDPVGSWLRIEVRGERPNTRALGAIVTVTTQDGGELVQQVGVGAHFLAQNDPRLLFGLGDEVGTVQVRVEFPSTGRSRTVSAEVDSTIVVQEPDA